MKSRGAEMSVFFTERSAGTLKVYRLAAHPFSHQIGETTSSFLLLRSEDKRVDGV
jgi:hypothetical protein